MTLVRIALAKLAYPERIASTNANGRVVEMPPLRNWRPGAPCGGLSAREFGEREGVRFQYLWNWKSAQGKAALARKTRAAITFAPVRVKDNAASVRAETVDAARVAQLATFRGAKIEAANRPAP